MQEIDIRKIFGENVRYYRKKHGFSQEKLSELLEISPNHLSVIETGGKFVTYKLLEKIVAVFGISPHLLFYSAENSENPSQQKIQKMIQSELHQAEISIQQKLQSFYRES
jgi:transcriptional regulator with XRE-family HTH domain